MLFFRTAFWMGSPNCRVYPEMQTICLHLRFFSLWYVRFNLCAGSDSALRTDCGGMKGVRSKIDEKMQDQNKKNSKKLLRIGHSSCIIKKSGIFQPLKRSTFENKLQEAAYELYGADLSAGFGKEPE